MKKISTITLLLISVLTHAQFLSPQEPKPAEKPIKASDPTQLYTSLNVDGGINFIDYEPDNWRFGFGGNIAIKERLQFGILAPISNHRTGSSLFSHVDLKTSFQIHNNSGVYNSSLVTFGVTTPVFDDLLMNQFNEGVTSTSYEWNIGYVGGIRISEKLAVYPTLQYYRKTVEIREQFYLPSGEIFTYPDINHSGVRTSLMLSVDFNKNNFVQLTAGYSIGEYKSEESETAFLNYNDIRFRKYQLSVRYQYRINRNMQVFGSIYQNIDTFTREGRTFIENQNFGGFRVGYIYFL